MSNSLAHKLLNRSLRKARVRAKVQATGTVTEKCAAIGAEVAKKAKKAKINAVVFDRNGRQYAGRLSALADAARNEGLEF